MTPIKEQIEAAQIAIDAYEDLLSETAFLGEISEHVRRVRLKHAKDAIATLRWVEANAAAIRFESAVVLQFPGAERTK